MPFHGLGGMMDPGPYNEFVLFAHSAEKADELRAQIEKAGITLSQTDEQPDQPSSRIWENAVERLNAQGIHVIGLFKEKAVGSTLMREFDLKMVNPQNIKATLTEMMGIVPTGKRPDGLNP